MSAQPELNPVIKEDWEPEKKLSAQFWYQTGKLTRYSKPPYPGKWKAFFYGLLETIPEETLWAVLEFLRSSEGEWWRNKIIQAGDPCEYLAKVLVENKPNSLLEQAEKKAALQSSSCLKDSTLKDSTHLPDPLPEKVRPNCPKGYEFTDDEPELWNDIECDPPWIWVWKVRALSGYRAVITIA